MYERAGMILIVVVRHLRSGNAIDKTLFDIDWVQSEFEDLVIPPRILDLSLALMVATKLTGEVELVADLGQLCTCQVMSRRPPFDSLRYSIFSIKNPFDALIVTVRSSV